MSRERLAERLAEAFRESPACSDAAWTHEEILHACRGELDPGRTRELVDLAVRDAAVADAWRIARALERRRKERRGAWRGIYVTVAAGLLLFVALWAIPRDHDRQRPALLREGATYEITSTIGDEPLPRDDFELQWSAGPDGARYFLEVADMDLDVLYTARQLDRNREVVPAESLAELAPGDLVLWRVEAFLEDGRHIRSATFDAELAD